MPVFKGSFIFKAGENGWTESWYFVATSLANAVPVFRNYYSYRDELLGDFAYIKAMRVAEEPASGVVDIENRVAPPVVAGAPAVRDTAWNAVLAICRAGGSRRQMWMRGLPDRSIAFNATNGEPILNNLLDAALKRWAAFAVKDPGALCLKVKLRPGAVIPAFSVPPMAGNLPSYNIASIVRLPDVNRVRLTIGAHTIPQFAAVTVKNGRRGKVPWLRGSYSVLEADATTITIATPNDPQTPIEYIGGTSVYRNVYTYPPIQNIKYGRFASRQTGRNLFVSAGRRRNRV